MTLRRCLEGRRFGCVLSAGFFGFYGHAGFVDGLLGAGLRPAAWAGTSAGGMVAALAASGVERADLCEKILGVRRADFWDPDPVGMAIDAVRAGHRSGGLLKGRRFGGLLTAHLKVRRFEDCPAPLLLCVTNLSTQQSDVITSGDLPSAVLATCAYPGLFPPIAREGALLWDGGVVDKAPAVALADSAIGKQLEVLLVHFLPSRDAPSGPKGPMAFASGVAGGMAASRKEHFRLQLKLLEARGVEVHVVTSALPPVGPGTMARGADALAAGRASIQRALDAPPASWLGTD